VSGAGHGLKALLYDDRHVGPRSSRAARPERRALPV